MLVGLFAVVGCASANTPTAQPIPMRFTPLPHSMKGWELYSWQGAGGDWRFVLAGGTNRVKTAAEIIQPSGEGTLIGVYGVKAELARLPKGEQVFWGTRGLPEFRLPPQPIVDEIQDYCRRSGIELTIF